MNASAAEIKHLEEMAAIKAKLQALEAKIDALIEAMQQQAKAKTK